MIRNHEKTIIASDSGRVDKILSLDEDISRSIFSRDDTVISVNGRTVKKSQKVKAGDEISVSWTEECFEGLVAEDLDVKVLYEDEDMLVVDKAQGMVVHPGAGNWEGTLVNALLYRYGEDFMKSEDDVRPGIVHRLDKDTSGVLVVAKNDKALENLSRQFAEHTNEKYYYAIAEGSFKENMGVVEKNIARSERDRKLYQVTDNPEKGRSAKTSYKVERRLRGAALLKIRIYTGRTHQIRVHMKSIGHPLVGDVLYNPKKQGYTLMLHSTELTLTHPRTGERLTFTSALPERFKAYIEEHEA